MPSLHRPDSGACRVVRPGTGETPTGRWLICPQPRPDARLALVCFPHAGGAAITYRSWASRISEHIEVRAIELPGRGSRLLEPAVDRRDLLVEQVVDAIQGALDRPYVFFGHSFGALLAFELARSLRRNGNHGPLGLVVSACAAPHRMTSRSPQSVGSDKDLVARLGRLGGTPAPVLADPEMVRLLIPAFRADLKMVGDYSYVPEPPLAVPIVAFGGTEDPLVNGESLRAWQAHTTSRFATHLFSGDHFFVRSNRDAVLHVLDRELEQIVHASA